MARKSRNRNRTSSRPDANRAPGAPGAPVAALPVEVAPVDESVVAVDSAIVVDAVVEDSLAADPPVIEAPPSSPIETASPTEPTTPAVDSVALMQRMADQVAELHRMIAASQAPSPAPEPVAIPSPAVNDETLAELRGEVDQLASMLRAADAENEDLRQQNNDLATRLASSNVRSTVSSPESSVSDALTWDERKALILKQMEQDDFDADAFVDELRNETANRPGAVAEIESPIAFVESLQRELDRRDNDLRNRDDEIAELKMLLQQRRESQGGGGVAFGAAAIAEIVDSDELVMQERERLQSLQDEWEEKFRRSEIEASLERAKLARERQQLANKTAELEEQIEHLRREARQNEEVGKPTTRRWLTKLGLNDKSESS